MLEVRVVLLCLRLVVQQNRDLFETHCTPSTFVVCSHISCAIVTGQHKFFFIMSTNFFVTIFPDLFLYLSCLTFSLFYNSTRLWAASTVCFIGHCSNVHNLTLFLFQQLCKMYIASKVIIHIKSQLI